ncbi:G-box-binding factor-like [Mytilus trossulus]|uniref:G-box-binding factor-like n=1 Tax=Mytilus trossulus TaxID=6551 RepID=UPI0030043751
MVRDTIYTLNYNFISRRIYQQCLKIRLKDPSILHYTQQRLHQQRLQLHQLHQHQQQAFLQQVSNHQLQQLLLSQQQQGQQIRESPMMMQQQLRGPNSQGQHNVMGGAQQMIPNSMQMGQQGQVMDQDQSNLLDNFDFDDLF